MIKMDQRNKWILIVIIIGSFACGITVVAYYAVLISRDLNSMEARRPILLYETDHRELLKVFRELSKRIDAGLLETGSYRIHGVTAPESKKFPQLILDLDPLYVNLEKDGRAEMIMSSVVMYGVVVYPEDFEGSLEGLYQYAKVWGFELIDGLWYYDEDFRKHPEHMKEVKELLKKRR